VLGVPHRSWGTLPFPEASPGGPGPPRREPPKTPCALSTRVGRVPRRVGREARPVGSCAQSASTGNDARRGGPGLKEREGVMTDDARWFVGVDWASQAHQACLIDAGGKIISEQAFAHGGAGLAELCTWLLAKTGAAPSAIAVAIEVPHGPIVET